MKRTNTRPVIRGCLAILLGLACLPAAAWPADWPQFLGPERNATSAETGLLPSWPEKGPPVAWQRDVGSGHSGVVVAGDRLILFHRVGDQEVVECLDPATGKLRWKHAYATGYEDQFGMDNGPRSTPVIAGRRVYTLGAEGRLHCLDLDDGKKVWDRSLNQEYRVPQGFFGVATSPIVEGDRLLLNVGGKKAGIVAFETATGKEVWKATDHEASYASPVATTVDGARHALFFTREGIVSLNPKDGSVRFSQRWRARIDASVNAASPVVVDGHAFFSASYSTGAILLRLRADGLDEVWKGGDVLSNHYNTSVRHREQIYGIEGRQEYGASLRCIDWKTGKVRWTREGFGCAALIVVENRLLALTEKGELVLVEATPEAYREKARATVLGGPCRAEIALANGRLYGRDGKKLVCLDLRK